MYKILKYDLSCTENDNSFVYNIMSYVVVLQDVLTLETFSLGDEPLLFSETSAAGEDSTNTLPNISEITNRLSLTLDGQFSYLHPKSLSH